MTTLTAATSPANLNLNTSGSLALPSSDSALAIVQSAQQAALSYLSEEQNPSSQKAKARGIAIDPPKKESSDFFEVMIVALSNLAAATGEMIDSVKTQLDAKRREMKNLLESRLRDADKIEERRQTALEAEKEAAKKAERKSIFGRVVSFAFSGAEVIGGIITAGAGVISGQPSLIAGGLSLVAAGTLGIAAEAVDMAGGNEKVVKGLKMASMGFLVAGVILTTYGAAGSAMVAKKGTEAGVETMVKKSVKNQAKKATEKMADNVAESAARALEASAKRIAKEGANSSAKQGAEAVALEAGEQALETAAREVSEEISKNLARQAAEAATYRGIAQKAGREAAEIAAKRNSDIAAHATANQMVKNAAKVALGTALAGGVYNGVRSGQLDMEQGRYALKAAELEHQITELQAELKLLFTKEEFQKKQIALIVDYAKRLNQDLTDGAKLLNGTIQDSAQVAKTLSRSSV